MATTRTYLLTGYGSIPQDWVLEMFGFLKQNGVNLRKVVAMQPGNTASSNGHYAMLELHLVLPEQSDCLDGIRNRLGQIQWISKTFDAL